MIIYQNDQDKCVGVLMPMADCPLPVEAIARKDVPAGAPYRIVPNDFFGDTPREEWSASFEKPDGYGANYGAGTDLDVIGFFVGEDELLNFEVRDSITKETMIIQA